MGVEGTFDYIADLISSTHRKKRRQLNTVELKVRMDCEGCGDRIKRLLSGMKGVRSVTVDWKQQKAVVYGFVDHKKVLKKAKSTGKKVEPWPYVPYELIAHPYAAGVYDKKAPPNYVRGTDEPGVGTLNPVEEQYARMFSDDNPHACSIMSSIHASPFFISVPIPTYGLEPYWEKFHIQLFSVPLQEVLTNQFQSSYCAKNFHPSHDLAIFCSYILSFLKFD